MFTTLFILVAAAGLLLLGGRPGLGRRWVLVRPAALAARCAPRELSRARLGDLLASGRTRAAERALRADPGAGVRVLAAIRGAAAGRLLERQLARRDCTRLWADIANALREKNRTDALPAVLRCAEAAAGTAHGPAVAVAAVAFPNFPELLRVPATPHGQAALTALVCAARGCRDGAIPVAALARAGAAGQLAALSAAARPTDNPWVVAAVIEAERVARRTEYWVRLLPPADRPDAENAAALLASSADRRADWLVGARAWLADRFAAAPPAERCVALRCLADLRADVSPLLPQLPGRRVAWWADAVRALRWAKSPATSSLLTDSAAAMLRGWRGRRGVSDFLTSLRGHASPEAERILVRGCTTRATATRRAAAASLGWWEPFDPAAVIAALAAGRADPDPAVRQAATGALARLGNRAAVQEYAAAMAGEEPALRRQAALAAADDGLTWLWPELQEMAEGSDPDMALAAAEALERLREYLFGLSPVGRGW